MSKLPIVERLEACPDIANARIVAPGMRTPEVVVPASLRDEAATTITELVSALEECQRALAAMVEPNAIRTTTAIDAYAMSLQAEARARTALSNTRGDTK